MAASIFPDNTVLINFACIQRLDLLEGWLRGRGRWTEAVHDEAKNSVAWWPGLQGLHAAGWLGQPVELDQHLGEIERIRRTVFLGTSAKPKKHLGEAQTCFLLQHDHSWHGSWWISDDGDALDYAEQQNLVTRETIDIFENLVADGDLTAQQAYDLLHEIASHDRHLRLPRSPADLG